MLRDFYNFCPLQAEKGVTTHYYNLVPLYLIEREFEKTNGIAPLLEAMSKKNGSLIVRPDRDMFV